MYSIHWMVLLVVGLVAGKGTYITIPKEFIEDAIKGSVHCTEELGLPIDTLSTFLSNKFEDSLPMRKYIYCLGIVLDVGEENGSLKHSLSKYAGSDKRKMDAIETIDRCNKEEASDKYEKAYKVSSCYLNTSPAQFIVPSTKVN